MRKILVALTGTVSGLIMLFSYHTSLGGATTMAAPIGAGTTATALSSAATPTPTSSETAGAPSDPPAPGRSSAPSRKAAATTAKLTGDTVQTQWGPVQVEITVTDKKITDVVAVVYPHGNGRDQEINAYALPILAQEALKAQSAKIDTISGATVTSDGYVQSLQAALDQANL